MSDQKKITNYPAAVAGYRKWWGNKTLQWFDPPRGEYESGEMAVVVNPELGLDIDGRPYVIKLYFKQDPLSKLKVDLISDLLEDVLRPTLPDGSWVGILDVRRSRLFASAPSPSSTIAIVNAELSYVQALWGA